jgi:hypothetical protein
VFEKGVHITGAEIYVPYWCRDLFLNIFERNVTKVKRRFGF